jgi:hypothetical protein
MNILKNRNFYAILLIISAALSRFLPHPPNFTPIMAMAIFGGAVFSDKRIAFAIPIVTMLITDLFFGFYSAIWSVYLAFAISVLLGMSLKSNIKVSRILLTSLSSSLIFYLLTNFAFWFSSGLYPLNLAGLNQAYLMGLPFFRYSPLEMFSFSLIGDLFFTLIFFGAYLLAEKYVVKPQLS